MCLSDAGRAEELVFFAVVGGGGEAADALSSISLVEAVRVEVGLREALHALGVLAGVD